MHRARVVVAVAAVALGAAWSAPAASADPARKSHLSGKHQQAFWDWLLEPNALEVRDILFKVGQEEAQLNQQPVIEYTGVYFPDRAELRARFLADAAGMLRYARRLAPHDVEVERELAIVLDEAGAPDATAALERYLADESPDRLNAELRVRLARWYGRQRRYDDALGQLRLALANAAFGGPPRTQAVLLGAEILMNTGRLADAIDLLRGAVSTGPGYLAPDWLAQFALAVAYDRDEQLGQAHDVLARMMSSDQHALEFALVDQSNPMSRNPFIPEVERHYFTALQYEALGHLVEARSEWQAYAADDDAPYRQRARQHVADIERLLRKADAEKKAPAAREAAPLPAGGIP